MSLETRRKAEGEIMRLKAGTELPLPTLLAFAWIPERTWREWQGRRGAETKHNNNVPRGYYLTPLESEAIFRYCPSNYAWHPEKGCRTLCWEIVDKNNVINRHRLGKKREGI
ncbi:MAG: hypothetical protein LBI86_04940 [Treponema sp.]|jgi:hypothetical protein|nr:hypothetical protein [Treponema sp.]